MDFDWSKYLDFAEYIKDNYANMPDAEACYRASVSRAYYSVYGLICCYIEDVDHIRFNSGDMHKRVIGHFKESGDELKRKIALKLDNLRFERVKADYYRRLGRVNPRQMAGKAIFEARAIKGLLDKLFE